MKTLAFFIGVALLLLPSNSTLAGPIKQGRPAPPPAVNKPMASSPMTSRQAIPKAVPKAPSVGMRPPSAQRPSSTTRINPSRSVTRPGIAASTRSQRPVTGVKHIRTRNPGWLPRHEQRYGGHLLKKHSSATRAALVRIHRQDHMSAVRQIRSAPALKAKRKALGRINKLTLRSTSAFLSPRTAESAAAEILQAQRHQINNWLKTGTGGQKAFEHSFTKPIGRIFDPKTGRVTRATRAVLYLERRPGNRYRIVTGYPLGG